MDLVQSVVANIITTTSISAIVLFIGKAMFSKTVETFFSIQILKAKQELDQKTEGFKLELDRASKVGLHKLEVIQVRRVEKIESIYGEIIALRDKAQRFLVEYEGEPMKSDNRPTSMQLVVLTHSRRPMTQAEFISHPQLPL